MKRKPNYIYIRRWILCAVVLLVLSYWLSLLFSFAVNANRQINETSPVHQENSSVTETPGTSYDTQQPEYTKEPPSSISRSDEKPAFNLILVNENHPVENTYYPDGMINIYDTYGSSIVPLRDTSVIMNEEAYLAFREMFIAAKDQGIYNVYILSAYRSYDKQAELYDNDINNGGSHDKYSKVAKPGESEHHTGLAIDLAIDDNSIQVTQEFEDTKQGQWFLENCWDYGFIVRYPSDKKDITGVIYEPWHFRYVGKEHSTQMKTLNLCLEEYIDYLYK